jgi:hypothetical protein
MSVSKKKKKVRKGKLDEDIMNDRLTDVTRPNHGTKSVIGILAEH